MRRESRGMGRRLIQLGLAIGAVAAGICGLPQTAGYVQAISDNSALYSTLGDVADVRAGREAVAAMSNVTTQAVTSPGAQLRADLTPTQTETGIDPGSAAEPTERSVEAYLSESYNADYELYEFGFNNRYFFYSNVSNGGMTEEPVRIEIPGNISYTLERDGAPVAYTQNTNITMPGSYVLEVSVTETDGLVTTHYVSYYRFRLMEARVQEAPETENAGEAAGEGETGTDPLTELMSQEDLSEEELAALAEALENGEIDLSDEDYLNPDGSINQEAIDRLVRETLEDEIGSVDDIYQREGVSEASGIASVYDYTTGYYLHTLISGQSFYTDVPNGGITRQTVTLRAGNGLGFTIYKDGVLYEEENTSSFTEAGSYLLIPTSEDVIYLSAYEEELPVFCFRIINRAVNDLSVYHAPEGFVIDSVRIGDENEPAQSALILNETTALLREDGEYRIRIRSEASNMEVTYLLDRVRPRFSVEVQKNIAQISYASRDVVRSIVYRNEQPYVTNQNIIYKLTDTGTYWYYAQDAAGNVTGRAFTVKYGFNGGAVAAILIVIAALIGLVVYIRYMNKHTRVR